MLGVRQGDRRAAVAANTTVDRRERWLAIGVLALLLLPLVVAAVRIVGRSHAPIDSDNALIELRVRDVGTAHTPLVGSYDRFGFNQPGPALLYALTVPYRLAGSQAWGLQLGALCINAAAVVFVMVIARRRAGLVGAMGAAAVLSLALHGMGAHGLANPWEPWIVILALVALAVAVVDVLNGHLWSLVAVAVFASFAAEVVLAVSLVAFVLAVVAFAAVVVRARRERIAWATWRRPVGVAVGVGVVAWLPPAIDIAVHRGGNLRRVLDFARGGDTALGWRGGYRLLSLQMSPRGSWLTDRVPLNTFVSTIRLAAAPLVPVALVVMLVAAGLAWRRGARRAAVFAGVALLMAALYVVAYSRVVGEVFQWFPYFGRPAGIVVWMAGGACAWAALPPPVRRRVAAGVVGALAVVIALTTVVSVRNTASEPLGPPPDSRAIERLGARVAPELRSLGTPVLVSSEVPSAVFANISGRSELTLALVRRGVHVVVADNLDDRVRYGDWRVDPAGAAHVALVAAPSGYTPPAGSRVLAVVDPLTPEQRALRTRAAQLPRESLAELRRHVANDPALRALVAQLATIPDFPPLAVVLTPQR